MKKERESKETSILEVLEYFKNGIKFLFLKGFKHGISILTTILIFFYKNWIKVFILVIIGLSIGVIVNAQIEKPITYQGSMIIKPNYGSTQEIYNMISSYQQMIINKKFDKLASVLEISEKDASSLASISIGPLKNLTDPIISFMEPSNTFIMSNPNSDENTIKFSNLKEKLIENYEENYTPFMSRSHVITLLSKDPDIYDRINKHLFISIEKNPYYKHLQETYKKNYITIDSTLRSSIEDINKLQESYNLMLKNENYNRSNNKVSLQFKDEVPMSPEILALDKKKEFSLDISRIKTEYLKNYDIVSIIATFPSKGEGLTLFKSYVLPSILISLLSGIGIFFILRLRAYVREEISKREATESK